MKSTSNDSAGSSAAFDTSEASPTQLLISVRSEQEIDAAIAGGADIVDLKEPSNGALAPTSVQLWDSVSRKAHQYNSVRFSAALGESREAVSIAQSLPETFTFAKVGPSGCNTSDRMIGMWSNVSQRLNPAIELVAVAYADHEASKSLPAETVFSLAAEFGMRRCLIDTRVKDGRTTIDHLGMDGLQRLALCANENRLWWALAGSMRQDQVESLRGNFIQPDCFGVRGDVCKSGREGTLSASRVMQWKQKCLIRPSCLTRPSQVRSGS